MLRRLLGTLVILFTMVALPAPAEATVSLQVSPALLELSATPGSTGQQRITVTNSGDERLDALVQIQARRGIDPARTADTWLQVSPSTIQLDAGESAEIEVTIAVPDGLESGGYYTNIVIASQTSPDAANQTTVSGGISVPLLFVIDGDGQFDRTVSLDHFAPVLEADGRIGFLAEMGNAGNIHVHPAGHIEVASAAGDALGSLEMPGNLLLPGAHQVMQAQGSLPLPPGSYDATVAITRDDDEENPLTQAITFDTTADVSLAPSSVCENLDKGPTLSIGMVNAGSLGVVPGISVSVQDAGGRTVGTASIPTVISWPGDSLEASLDFDERLASGNYTLLVEATYGVDQQLEQQTPFQIGGVGGSPVPLCGDAATPAA